MANLSRGKRVSFSTVAFVVGALLCHPTSAQTQAVQPPVPIDRGFDNNDKALPGKQAQAGGGDSDFLVQWNPFKRDSRRRGPFSGPPSTNSQYVVDCDVDDVEFELHLSAAEASCGAVRGQGATWNAVWCEFGSVRTACNCEKRTISIEDETIGPIQCKSWRVGPVNDPVSRRAEFRYQAQCEAESLELAVETRTANAFCGGVKAGRGKILNAVWCQEGSKISACNCEKRTHSIKGIEVAPQSCKSWQLALEPN